MATDLDHEEAPQDKYLSPTFDEPKVISALDDQLLQPRDWIVEDLLAVDEQMLLFGEPKVGKPQLTLRLALAVARGTPFLHWTVPSPRNVLYANLEIGDQIFMRRIAQHLENKVIDSKSVQLQGLNEQLR